MSYYRLFKTKHYKSISVRTKNYTNKQSELIRYAAKHLLVQRKPINKAFKPVSKSKFHFRSSLKVQLTTQTTHISSHIISDINQKIIRLRPTTTRIHSVSKKTFMPSSFGYSRIHATAQRGNQWGG